jgi:broad specificity phosphatase PhoE
MLYCTLRYGVLPTTRLYLIRHAHTSSNGGRNSLLSGRTDVPLSPRGRIELKRLELHFVGRPPFEAIYSSPLRRAAETAMVLEKVGLGSARRCPELQEIDCGELDGYPIDEVRSRFPDLWAANLRQEDEHFRWPGGESYREFRTRCLRAIRGLTHRHPGGRIAVITHAGVISQVLGFLGGESPARWEAGRPGTAAVTELEWCSGGACRVIRFDDRTHLLP